MLQRGNVRKTAELELRPASPDLRQSDALQALCSVLALWPPHPLLSHGRGKVAHDLVNTEIRLLSKPGAQAALPARIQRVSAACEAPGSRAQKRIWADFTANVAAIPGLWFFSPTLEPQTGKVCVSKHA